MKTVNNNLLDLVVSDKLSYSQRLRIETTYHELFDLKVWQSQSAIWAATIEKWLVYEGYEIIKKEIEDKK